MSILASIVVPVLNEERYITDCIESILQQDLPKNKMEILFVDARSTDNTRKIIETYLQKYPFINILDNAEKSVPKAMNMGIAFAKGKYIIRMDAHCRYDPAYVSTCLEILRQTRADNVGGPMRAIATDYTGKAIAAAHHSFFGLGGGKFHDDECEGYVDTVYLGAFPKQVFQKVGLYDERLIRNQDIELNSRIIERGGKIYLNPKIKSYYYNRATLTCLWKQNFENGKWSIYTIFVHKNALSIRHFIPLLFAGGIVLLIILGLFINFFKALLMFTFGIYFFCSLISSFIAGWKKGIQYVPLLPIVFCVLHFSYGIGSLYGLITVNLWIKSNNKQKNACLQNE